jgi:hypothetical protein
MNQSTQTGKRIVSKGRYIVSVGGKFVFTSVGMAAFLVGVACVLSTFLILAFILMHSLYLAEIFYVIALIVLGGASVWLLRFGLSMMKEGKQMDSGIPHLCQYCRPACTHQSCTRQ